MDRVWQQAPEPGEGTALAEGTAAPEGTALEGGTTAPDPGALLEVPEKFKNEDGSLNDQGILKSYGELEKKIGSGGTPPESADGYKIELEGKFPEGVEINAEEHKEFLGRCHEKGMSNDMVQFIMDEYAGVITEAVAENSHTRAGTVEKLKEVFREHFATSQERLAGYFKGNNQ